MLRKLSLLAASAALFVNALPALAWWPGSGGIGNGGFGPGPFPPSYYGYPLDDFTAGYYGGSRYKEYYAFGRGFGVADFPGPLPGPIYPYGYRQPRPEPCVQYAAPVVTVPVLQDPHCALLEVHVPSDAVVLLEGNPTKQSGESRQFVSPPLKTGAEYHYEVKARWKKDGHEVEETKQITVHAGQRVNVNFLSSAPLEKVATPNQLPLQASR